MRAQRSQRTCKLKCETLESRHAPALLTQQLLDINQNTIDGTPSGPQFSSYSYLWQEYNGEVYFNGDNSPPGYDDAGTELWKTDGTADGTVMVKDIYPGFYGSGPSDFTVSNGLLFFSANDGVHGSELWKTDGTEAGTVMVKNIGPLTPNLEDHSSYPSSLTDVNGILYFTADDDVTGFDLWRSDGTFQGTYRVKDFHVPSGYPGGDSGFSAPNSLTNVNGTLFLTAMDSSAGRALWKSDGTDAGTVMIKDLNPGGLQASLLNPTAVGNNLFFTVYGDATYGTELWKSDGTTDGTGVVKDIKPGNGSSDPEGLTAMNGILYFEANAGGLWRSDGTSDGTYLVKQLGSPLSGSYQEMVNANGTLYTVAYVNTGDYGYHLWKSDGTAAGTVDVGKIDQSDASHPSSTKYNLTAVGGGVYFIGYDSTYGVELWHSDGSAVGTGRVKDINTGTYSSSPANLLASSNGLFFSADDYTHGRELWHSDGTSAGTALVKDVNPTTADSVYDAGFTPMDGQVFFVADDGSHGTELWKTDGIAGDTSLVKDINPGRASGVVGALSSEDFEPVVLNDVLYFAADDGVNGRELWRSDGTAAGTYMLKDIIPGSSGTIPRSSDPQDLTVFNGVLYFFASTGAGFYQLWRSDGTANGTYAFTFGAVTGSNLTVVGGTLYFVGYQPSSQYGTELWKTDGTDAGTVMIKDIYPGANSSSPAYLTDFDNTLFFSATDGTHGTELWRSDGTDAGTYMVKDIDPGSGSGVSLFNVAVMNGILYFGGAANGSASDLSELWRSDGTTTGTYQVRSDYNGELGGPDSDAFSLRGMAVLNGILLFQGFDSYKGFELWKSDGTSAGTGLLKQIMNPDPYGVLGSMPALMTNFNGEVYLTADDWHHGREIWRTDGTTTGTVLFKDINDIPLGVGSTDDLAAYPGELTNINGTLYFSADDGRTGRELWTISAVAPVATLGPIAPNPRNTSVSSIPITFTEPVTGFDLNDLRLTRNGAAVSLAGASLTSSDNINWTLANLASVTAAEGSYVLTLNAVGSGIEDADQITIAADASTTWSMDLTGPAATDVVDVSPDPRNTPVPTLDVTFSEPIDVSTFTAADLTLTRDGSPLLLSDLTFQALGGSNYRVSGLSSSTSAEGDYVFTLSGSGINDLAGNAGTGSVFDEWVTDLTAPVVIDVTDVSPDPRNAPVSAIDVTFSKPIELGTFNSADLALTRDGNAVPLSGLTFSALGGTTYRVSGLDSATAAEGHYVLTVIGSGISDPAGNAGTGLVSDAWVMDLTAPIAEDVIGVSPDPRNSPVSIIDIAFSEPIDLSTLSAADLSLTRNGTTVPLSGLTVESLGGSVYRVAGLDSATAAEGDYLFTVYGAGITDSAGNVGTGSASDEWLMDLTPPTVTDVVDVSPDPRNTPVAALDVTFSEPIDLSTFTAADLILTRNGSTVPPSGLTFESLGGSTYGVSGLASATAAEGNYSFAVDGTGINDVAGNVGAGSATADWVTDLTPPTVTGLGDVAPDPRNSPVSTIDVTLSEPIDLSTFTAADLTLMRNGTLVSLAGLTVAALGANEYRVSGLDSVTAAEGTYDFTVRMAGMADSAGNAGVGSATTDWVMDTTEPTVTIAQAPLQADPTNSTEIQFDVVFSEPVLGFDGSKITLSGTAGDSLSATVASGAGPNEYTVTVVGMTSSGTVVAGIAADVVTDAAGNGNSASTSADDTVTFDNVPPSVTINPLAGEADPTAAPAIVFEVVFSEPIVGFDATALDLSASTAAGALRATVAGSGPSYTVTVTGMTSSGTVVASIGAGTVADLAGNDNTGSNIATVNYVHAGTVQFASATFDVDETGSPILTVTVTRTGGSEGPLDVNFATGNGTAVPGVNYVSTSGTLSWLDGDSADKSIAIPVLDDGVPLGDSTFGIALSAISLYGALGTPAAATVTIHEGAVLEFSQADSHVSEGSGFALLTVHRRFGNHGAVSVNYATSDGSANAGADYATTNGILSWADGDASDKTFAVPIVDDSLSEGDETIHLTLESPTGNALLGDATTDLIIDKSDGLAAGKQPFSDADGDLVTVKLGGKSGTLMYYLTNGTGPISEIDMSGTSPTKSTVAITVKRLRHGNGDGQIAIGKVQGSGLKSFTARSSDLVGAGIHLSGFLGSLTIRDVKDGADIDLAGSKPSAKSATRITTGVIEDGADITVAAPISGLTAIAVGNGTIAAPSVGSIRVTGRKATKSSPAIAGDFRSALSIEGTGLASKKAQALRSLMVAGAVSGATIQIGGDAAAIGSVGIIRVGSFIDSRLFAGYSGPDDGSGSFNLPSTVGTFRITGKTNSFANSLVIASTFRNVSLASVDANNQGSEFGFLFKDTLHRLAVRSPTFLRYDPKGPAEQDLAGDFVVKRVQ